MIYVDYYGDFKCKCGDCRHVCCGGWGITVSDEEYFRLLGLDCPPELRNILDCALAVVDDPRPERYAMMKPSYTGKCRLIDENGLCSLQVACGEEVLPAVCRMYPRSLTEKHAGCSASCERVTEMLMRDAPLSFSEKLPNPLSDCVKALQDRSSPLKNRLEKLLYKTFDKDLTYLYPGLLYMYFGYMEKSSEHFAELIADFEDKYKDDPHGERLFNDLKEFDTAFPQADLWFENLIVNRMFISDFPGDDIKTALCGVVCEYALLRSFTSGCRAEEQFVDTVSDLYRFIGHTNFNKNSAAAIKNAGAYSADGLSAMLVM